MGLVREELCERLQRRPRIRTDCVGDFPDEREFDAVVGGAPRGLGERVGLVEEERLGGGAEHAAAQTAVGEHEGMVGDDDVRPGGRLPRGNERGCGRGAASRGHRERVGGALGGEAHPVRLRLFEGREAKERFEGARVRAARPVPEPLECAFHPVVVDELPPPRPGRDRDLGIAEGLEGPGLPSARRRREFGAQGGW